MNIQEIADQAFTLAGVPIDLFKTRRFINDASERLSQLYDTACIKVSIPISCIDINQEYELPSDCIGVYKVTTDGKRYSDFLAESGSIIFNSIGNYNVICLKVAKLTDRKLYDKLLGTDTPSLNIAYHRVLPSFVAAQILFLANPNDAKAVVFMQDFKSMSESIDTKLNKLKRKGARVKAPMWR